MPGAVSAEDRIPPFHVFFSIEYLSEFRTKFKKLRV
jgi:hypothetical protein